MTKARSRATATPSASRFCTGPGAKRERMNPSSSKRSGGVLMLGHLCAAGDACLLGLGEGAATRPAKAAPRRAQKTPDRAGCPMPSGIADDLTLIAVVVSVLLRSLFAGHGYTALRER